MKKQNMILWIIGAIIIGFLFYQYYGLFTIISGSKIVYVDESICESNFLTIEPDIDLLASFCLNSFYWLDLDSNCTRGGGLFDFRIVNNITNKNILTSKPRDYTKNCYDQLWSELLTLGTPISITGRSGNIIHSEGWILSELPNNDIYNIGDYAFCDDNSLIIMNSSYYPNYLNYTTECIPKDSPIITENWTNQTTILNYTYYTNQTFYINQTINQTTILNYTYYINQTTESKSKGFTFGGYTFDYNTLIILIVGGGIIFYLYKIKGRKRR